MKAKEKRTLSVTLEFTSNQDLSEIFKYIKRAIREDNIKQDASVRGHNVVFETRNEKINLNKGILEENKKYHFETINGKNCVIYQSKMNK